MICWLWQWYFNCGNDTLKWYFNCGNRFRSFHSLWRLLPPFYQQLPLLKRRWVPFFTFSNISLQLFSPEMKCISSSVAANFYISVHLYCRFKDIFSIAFVRNENVFLLQPLPPHLTPTTPAKNATNTKVNSIQLNLFQTHDLLSWFLVFRIWNSDLILYPTP